LMSHPKSVISIWTADRSLTAAILKVKHVKYEGASYKGVIDLASDDVGPLLNAALSGDWRLPMFLGQVVAPGFKVRSVYVCHKAPAEFPAKFPSFDLILEGFGANNASAAVHDVVVWAQNGYAKKKAVPKPKSKPAVAAVKPKKPKVSVAAGKTTVLKPGEQAITGGVVVNGKKQHAYAALLDEKLPRPTDRASLEAHLIARYNVPEDVGVRTKFLKYFLPLYYGLQSSAFTAGIVAIPSDQVVNQLFHPDLGRHFYDAQYIIHLMKKPADQKALHQFLERFNETGLNKVVKAYKAYIAEFKFNALPATEKLMDAIISLWKSVKATKPAGAEQAPAVPKPAKQKNQTPQKGESVPAAKQAANQKKKKEGKPPKV